VTAQARREAIERRVTRDGEVDFATLTHEFDVSEMTIRRDIEALEEKGVLRRVRGGAIAFRQQPADSGLASRDIEAAEKAHIADVAVTLLQPNETVLIDSGSTALAVAKALRGRDLGLTIVTPSILVAVELADDPGTTVILTGGRVKPGELSLVGEEAAAVLSLYNCDTYIMGAAGLDAAHGVTEYQRDSGFLKRAALPMARRTVVVADASKLGEVELLRVAALNAISAIVTDGPPDDPTLVAAREAGVDVVLAASPGRESGRGRK
jgi:DeoR/GlpR family transcriptional regulator of sugar metabolism